MREWVQPLHDAIHRPLGLAEQTDPRRYHGVVQPGERPEDPSPSTHTSAMPQLRTPGHRTPVRVGPGSGAAGPDSEGPRAPVRSGSCRLSHRRRSPVVRRVAHPRDRPALAVAAPVRFLHRGLVSVGQHADPPPTAVLAPTEPGEPVRAAFRHGPGRSRSWNGWRRAHSSMPSSVSAASTRSRASCTPGSASTAEMTSSASAKALVRACRRTASCTRRSSSGVVITPLLPRPPTPARGRPARRACQRSASPGGSCCC